MALIKGLIGLIVCCLSASCGSSHTISREVLNVSRGRVLLDGPLPDYVAPPPPQKCKVNFMKYDYSPLSTCTTPFPRIPCCEGFKEIACPVGSVINDLETDCASNMFTGIYDYQPTLPPSYFVDNCQEGPYGLDCLLVNQRNEAKAKAKRIHGRSPRHVLSKEEAEALAKRKAEIMSHHPKLFPQAALT